MKENSKSLYNRLVPKLIRQPIDNQRAKNKVLEFYDSLPDEEISEEEISVLNYLRKNKMCVFPYSFQHDYRRKDISVYKDEKLKMKFVLADGKRLYFKRSSSSRGIKRNYTNLLIEQDLKSPHRYLTNGFDVPENAILVDVGAAEGMLALSVIERVKKVYLFESDRKWIEALEATFSPWKDKVEIVNKFVSAKNDEKKISLDEFFTDKQMFDFLKIDAEGAEEEILTGSEKIFSSNQSLRVALCCYHKPDDEKQFVDHLMKRHFSVALSDGYMIFNEPKTFAPPYLRRGVIRAEKNV